MQQETTQESEYRAYLANGELRMQQCGGCGYVRHPPRWLCPECLSTDWSFQRLSGTGTIETFVWYCERVDPRAPDVPYNVAIVRVLEGPRVITNIIDVAFGDLKVGQKVNAIFTEDRSKKSILCFVLAEAMHDAD